MSTTDSDVFAEVQAIIDGRKTKFRELARRIANGESVSAAEIDSICSTVGKEPRELKLEVEQLKARNELRRKAATLKESEAQLEECQRAIQAEKNAFALLREAHDQAVGLLDAEKQKAIQAIHDATGAAAKLLAECPSQELNAKSYRIGREREHVGNAQTKLRDEIELWTTARDNCDPKDVQRKQEAADQIERLAARLTKLEQHGDQLAIEAEQTIEEMRAY